MLWNDDFYATVPIDSVPHMHRGELAAIRRQYRHLHGAWADGLRATATHLENLFPDRVLYSYEVHVPLIVQKQAMLDALQIVRSIPTNAPHKRTVYGNLARLGGQRIQDPKLSRHSTSLPIGPWLSSDDTSFGSVVRPMLHRLFPNRCGYET